jgi:hypothetical protein
MGTLTSKLPLEPQQIALLYSCFETPITELDCGEKCAPYNDHGVPFCCDTHHAVPTAYTSEWAYLRASTDLWHLYKPEGLDHSSALKAQTPPDQVLIECRGHHYCQRNFRSITCRSFPFFPYIDPRRHFIGVTYYWQYEDRCWVINHLDKVTPGFLREFNQAYQRIFEEWPDEIEQFSYQSKIMRQVFGRRRRQIPIFLTNGRFRTISTRTGEFTDVDPRDIPKFGVYEIADKLRFPNEID